MALDGPEGVVPQHAEIDARRCLSTYHASPDGEEHDVSGVYREVVPNRSSCSPGLEVTPERQSQVMILIKPTATAPC
jgi:hypothetical protein